MKRDSIVGPLLCAAYFRDKMENKVTVVLIMIALIKTKQINFTIAFYRIDLIFRKKSI